MVSISQVRIIGSWYMAFNGGFKPRPEAFIKFIREQGLKHERIFFMGNRLVDMELADSLKKELGCEVFKCLILRGSDYSVGLNKADKVVKNLWQVREEINKFKPDLVMSDFDNTLFGAGYYGFETTIEKLRFWEKYQNKLLNIAYALISLITIPFLNKQPYNNKYDNTRLFIKTLKQSLIIHTMSPELVVMNALRKLN